MSNICFHLLNGILCNILTKKRFNVSKNEKIVTWVVGFIVLWGIGNWWNNNHYTDTYRNNFLASCENNGEVSADTCGCALGVVEANYSYSQAKSFDNSLPSDVSDKISAQCE